MVVLVFSPEIVPDPKPLAVRKYTIPYSNIVAPVAFSYLQLQIGHAALMLAQGFRMKLVTQRKCSIVYSGTVEVLLWHPTGIVL